MKYFLFANTEKKPVMRFFEKWFEVVDFLNSMQWKIGQTEFPIYIYETIGSKMEDIELENKIRTLNHDKRK